ncbi:LGFP repeat-containing protein [Planobispora takensis]|uniref:Uncharacterized protein n=1 Tax=Planobispora takensis TaxID=1367882 RepID=A0A8J3T341_9ACTN|nr:hypothetical protein [Planobispora takensis]GII05429.1 hypothetical protein Pta02_74370 [Planobispora takensis]
MGHIHRAVLGLTATATVATGLALTSPAEAASTPPASPAVSQTAPCGGGIAVSGRIGTRWNRLGGQDSALGCPVTPSRDVYLNGVWAGRRQWFDRGSITWSPRQGTDMTVSAWSSGGYSYFDWGSTAPYSYDRFLVRWYSAADPGGEQREFGGGTGGRIRVRQSTTGAYRFIVEGCDNGVTGSSCRQGWTLSASTR